MGNALDEMDPETLHSPELTLTPRPQDHGSNLTCQVTLQGAQVTLETTVRLNVSCECGGAAGSPGGSVGRRRVVFQHPFPDEIGAIKPRPLRWLLGWSTSLPLPFSSQMLHSW